MAIGGGVAALLVTASGCSSSRGAGAPDGAAPTLDSGSAACAAAGGQCEEGVDCEVSIPQACLGSAVCCLRAEPMCAPDANMQPLLASSYGQSCAVDSDCIAVGLGDPCSACALGCANAAINKSSKQQYLADVAKAPAAGVGCFCIAGPELFSSTCCHGGQCQSPIQCLNLVALADASDSRDAADGGPADAGSSE
jgi:hypothetical protein